MAVFLAVVMVELQLQAICADAITLKSWLSCILYQLISQMYVCNDIAVALGLEHWHSLLVVAFLTIF